MKIDEHGLKRERMKRVIVAFDIDGTLRSNRDDSHTPNERIRTLLITLASFKNVRIHVWSGGGELYARQSVAAMGLAKYVDSYSSKQDADFTPDIAIDDIQECAMGLVNLIVCEK